MFIEFGIHRPLKERFRQLLQQPVLANDLLRLLIVSKQLVDQLGSIAVVSSILPQWKHRLHYLFYTL
jgi:hypothetical protein